ncbi:hypothetical protein P8V03_09855 [Clostridium sp. A1-XYC3]|uniref:Uncharacterized protein n=1 Tax=Clostridium tanneri TaxID=3037988 RepID=A0ABU4JU64_9CLOT|nr:hypothetical protein [Clostridium sp. A1-XYC3]MDW8801458.1 hypothetical protein [Clostridium sp. A1-XYC3]
MIIVNGYNISFRYNDSGIRTQKNANGVTKKYYLRGDKVTFGGATCCKWKLLDMTGGEFIESKITERLIRNSLSSTGIDILRITDVGKNASSLG